MSGNERFEIDGVSHLALVCEDMARTVDFYTNVLGFPLIKTVELPANMGQHFFFDIGNGDSLAFFWFRDAPPAAPGARRQSGRSTGRLRRRRPSGGGSAPDASPTPSWSRGSPDNGAPPMACSIRATMRA